MDEPWGVEANGGAGPSRTGTVAVPWDVLGPDVAAKLQPSVDTLVEDVLASVVRADVPREWVVGVPNARNGVEHGLRGLLELIETGPREQLPGLELYFGFGRGQLRAGRSLGGLLAAYHHGARATWQAIARRSSGAGLTHETLGALADAILAYLAEISAASAEGFAFEQAALGADRDDGRRRLVAAIARVPAASAAELHALARTIDWRADRPVAVLAFRHERIERVAARLAADALLARVDGTGYALVPDPDGPGRAAGLRARLRDVRAALGPTVELTAAAESARWARLALALGAPGADGTRAAPALVVATEHRVDLLLLCAPALASGLAEELLAPLDDAPEATRERLLETLAAWLRHQGAANLAGEELHVHAQTVRYRVAQLRDLLGERLDDAEGRLELELALRARRLRASTGAADR
ncbi:PucR family transcriptional regulator [Conexibacter woesei]|uniref:Transcriptional regulator, CdaR n=1 Tax=Conexibacter woesei (strain DSM 14684 / CCUG 47730 / CIP 108061 / JCM 11494 / NBRC 100937 / ID131577) TaxID=469383 RepID=D3EZZ5_CONWI|nr:helix-turn-helix domain-containing protein [Conexibacter woesei]ADB49971.1 transcriptional regulator, CdaR [Conexibacter woesei DSM 14684]